MDTSAPALRGPARTAERAPAPDLARGFMLLLIVLANTPWYLWAAPNNQFSAHPFDGSALDRVVQFVIITGVDSRIYPMFAFLFGYGLMRTYDRQLEAGAAPRDAAALLRRRHLWLLAFGLVHAALLFAGDILGAYGLAGLLLSWLFLRRAEGTVWTWGIVLSGLIAAMAVLSAVGAAFAAFAPTDAAGAGGGQAGVPNLLHGAFSEDDPLAAALNRLLVWPVMVLAQGLGFVVPAAILLGMGAARRRVLETPGRHLRVLAWTAVVGIGVAWLTGALGALAHVGALEVPSVAEAALAGVRMPTGLFGGVGYVAAFGLIGHWVSRRARRGVVVRSVTAVGRRSMSCYLAQSVLCAPLLAPWALGLGGVFGSASMAAFAVGVWLVTLVGAYALELADRRGPAEVALRRLAYRRPTGDNGGPAAAGGA